MNIVNKSALTNENFVGREHESSISLILTENQRGEGPRLHRHPYDETWLVEEGRVQVWIGDESGEAGAGGYRRGSPKHASQVQERRSGGSQIGVHSRQPISDYRVARVAVCRQAGTVPEAPVDKPSMCRRPGCRYPAAIPLCRSGCRAALR
jgi:hypothetical protein